MSETAPRAPAPAFLQALRPDGDDSASIAAAIARGEAAEAEARSNAEEAKATWSKMLLTASDAEMDDLERAAAQFARDAERIAAALPQLRQDLCAALKREARAVVVQAIEASNAAGQLFVRRWRDEYHTLATALASLLQDEAAAIRCRTIAGAGIAGLPGEDQDGLPALLSARAEFFDGPAVMGELIQLPAVDGTFQDAPWFDRRRGVKTGSSAGQYGRDRLEREWRAKEEARVKGAEEGRRKMDSLLAAARPNASTLHLPSARNHEINVNFMRDPDV